MKCKQCGDECKAIEERIDYAGTHCTHGNSGTYYTGNYLSDCCSAEIEDEDYSTEDQECELLSDYS